MNAGLARRQAALAGVALVGALGAIALSRLDDDSEAAPPPMATVEWQTADVAVFEPPVGPTVCGVTVTAETPGIAHPTYPCGARLLLEHFGQRVEAEVVDEAAVDPGVAFELSPALAQELGIAGNATVRWHVAE
jgi:hypothetical protein